MSETLKLYEKIDSLEKSLKENERILANAHRTIFEAGLIIKSLEQQVSELREVSSRRKRSEARAALDGRDEKGKGV